MTKSTAMEQGMVGGYPAETPSYNRGQTGKGVAIRGKVTARSGSNVEVGNDSYAAKLKATFGSAVNAKSRFGNF